MLAYLVVSFRPMHVLSISWNPMMVALVCLKQQFFLTISGLAEFFSFFFCLYNGQFPCTIHQFSFRYVTCTKVYKTIMDIKANAVGSDDIPLRFLKILLPPILSIRTLIFNSIYTSSVFPTCFFPF